jgi:hypothetical protein
MNNIKIDKSLNKRIEDLIKVIEKSFSYKKSFTNGVMQGLGFILGSTIVAGIGYTILTQFISPEMLHDMSIDAAIQRSSK